MGETRLQGAKVRKLMKMRVKAQGVKSITNRGIPKGVGRYKFKAIHVKFKALSTYRRVSFPQLRHFQVLNAFSVTLFKLFLTVH